jgi:hypothetical protein
MIAERFRRCVVCSLLTDVSSGIRRLFARHCTATLKTTPPVSSGGHVSRSWDGPRGTDFKSENSG